MEAVERPEDIGRRWVNFCARRGRGVAPACEVPHFARGGLARFTMQFLKAKSLLRRRLEYLFHN
eukprot:425223-Lingulodinium_polyedra.AAC.1